MVFGVRNLVLGFGIRWLESGIRFEVSGSVWSHCGTAILSRSPRTEDIDFTGRILIAHGGY